MRQIEQEFSCYILLIKNALYLYLKKVSKSVENFNNGKAKSSV